LARNFAHHPLIIAHADRKRSVRAPSDSSTFNASDAMDATENDILTALQQRLAPVGGGWVPQLEHVAVAVDLARASAC